LLPLCSAAEAARIERLGRLAPCPVPSNRLLPTARGHNQCKRMCAFRALGRGVGRSYTWSSRAQESADGAYPLAEPVTGSPPTQPRCRGRALFLDALTMVT